MLLFLSLLPEAQLVCECWYSFHLYNSTVGRCRDTENLGDWMNVGEHTALYLSTEKRPTGVEAIPRGFQNSATVLDMMNHFEKEDLFHNIDAPFICKPLNPCHCHHFT